MTEKEKELISNFEARLRRLIQQYDKLKDELAESKTLLEQERVKNNELAQELKEVKQNYTHLKTAKTISLYDKDILETKARLSHLVREVDKCINLLNG
ncbi:MAG: hypothetical protein GX963_08535 [Bacteroidales bacterium]|nr:hypothetical protein [Bacteroidales bacterium]